MIADLLARLARDAIVEFVPKEDAMVRRLLASRKDVFPDYTPAGFRGAFAARFERISEVPIDGTQRMLLHYRRLD